MLFIILNFFVPLSSSFEYIYRRKGVLIMINSFFLPAEDIERTLDTDIAAMNNITGAMIYALADPSIQALLPPPLKLAETPMLIMYASSIGAPLFAEPYREAGIGVMTALTGAQGKGHEGLYYFSLLLSGEGAQNATFFGREQSGLPKKIADSIVLQRNRKQAGFYVERNGIRLMEAQMELGYYNDPDFSNGLENLDQGIEEEAAVFTHRYKMAEGRYIDMGVNLYDSKTLFYQYEPACARVLLRSSENDPWGEIKIARVLGGSWYKNNNWVEGVTEIYSYPDSEVLQIMRYLYAGRFDVFPDLFK